MSNLAFILAGIIIASQFFVEKANARSGIEFLYQSQYTMHHGGNRLRIYGPVLSSDNLHLFRKNILSLPLQKEVSQYKVSNVLDEKSKECPSPGFWSKKSCWVILKEGEDCLVEPIIMQLEDQPVYCPREQIRKLPEIKTDNYQRRMGRSVL